MNSLYVHIPAQPASSYPIHIGPGLLEKPQIWLGNATSYERIILITDHSVKKHYGHSLVKRLIAAGYPAQLLSFPAGEKSKQQQTKQLLEEKMLRQRCGRNTLCLALGGGVVGDLTGFIAATYMRGIPYLQIPTTLLAMVDSSVGGKTGIDTPYGKNLLGAFWQPIAVVADTACLNTLPQKQLINGLVEALKMFLTNDLASWEYAVQHLDQLMKGDEVILQDVIHRAVTIKAKVVEQDEQENNLRMVLNLGHTIGHALEKINDYKMLHGYAVAYGILVEAKIAELLGILSPENYTTIQVQFARLGIRGNVLKKMKATQIIQATRSDKKVKMGTARYVLLKNLGEVYTEKNVSAHPVADSVVREAFANFII